MDNFINTVFEKKINLPDIEKILFIEPSTFIKYYSAYCFFRLEGALFCLVCGLGENLSSDNDFKEARAIIKSCFLDESRFIYDWLFGVSSKEEKIEDVIYRLKSFNYMTTRAIMTLSDLDREVSDSYYVFADKHLEKAMIAMKNNGLSFLEIYNRFIPNTDELYRSCNEDFISITDISKYA